MLATIGITTYRRLAYLQEAVESALNQSFDDYEILISQNPHPDDAVRQQIKDWCIEQTKIHPRIRYQENPENVGVAENINALADGARGEYVIVLGDDDRMLPDGLRLLAQHTSDDVDVVFANHTIITGNGEADEKLTAEMENRFGRSDLREGPLSAAEAELAAWNVSIPIAASLVRTSQFRKFRYLPHLTKGDTEFYIRMARANLRFVFTRARVSEVRYHDDRATLSIVGFGDLVMSLLDNPASEDEAVERRRRIALSRMTSPAVSDLLLHSRIDEARRVLRSPHFNRFRAKSFFQVLCGRLLPASLGVFVFRKVYRAYRIFSGENLTERDRLGQETLRESEQTTSF